MFKEDKINVIKEVVIADNNKNPPLHLHFQLYKNIIVGKMITIKAGTKMFQNPFKGWHKKPPLQAAGEQLKTQALWLFLQ